MSVRTAFQLLLAAGLAVGAAPALAQDGARQPSRGPARPATQAPAAQPQTARPDPAVTAAAGKIAGPYQLASADGTRTCPVTLKATSGPAASFAIEINVGACAAIPFAAEIGGWLPDASGGIRLRAADGRTLAEFSEATGGAYEALREGDGVYFLASPEAVQTAEVTAEEMLGDWVLARGAGGPALCRWTLTDRPAPARGSGLAVVPDTGCATALPDFAAASWRLEGGNVVVQAAAGQSLRFARQEDGNWAKTPERGRPLLLLRP